MTTPMNEIVDSLKVRVAGAGNNTWPQLSVSPSNSLWLTDSADPLNTSSNAALQITVTSNSAFLEALATDGVTNKQLQLGNAGGVALVPNGGNVGIGTASPSQALDVAGSVKATSFLLNNIPIVSSQWTSGAGGISFAGGNVGIGTATPSQALEVAGSVKATSFVLGNTPIVSSQWTSGAGGLSFAGGNVGIGTASPSQALDVAGAVKATSFVLGNTPIVSSQWTSGAGGINFAGGNVGIGTASPSQALEVAGAVKATSFVLGNTPIVSSQWTSGAGGINFAGGNVGIGTASPSQALDVAGTVKASAFMLGNAPLVNSQWANVAGGISFAGGNVGIGTASPSQALDVAGTVKASAFLLGNAPLVNSQWANVAGGINFAGGAVGIGTASPSQALDVAGTVKASAFLLGNAPLVNSQWANVAGGINFAGGNVGIGTATPDRSLTVQGGGGTYLNVKAANGTYEVLLGADGAGGIVSTMTNHDLQLRAGSNVTRMTVKANGNVGIGTGSPSQNLSVVGSISVDEGNKNNGAIGQNKTGPGLYFGVPTGEFIASNRNAGPNQYGIDFYTLWTPRLSIVNGGAVGIGTRAPDRALTIQGSGGVYMNVKAVDGAYEVLLGADGAGGIVSTMTNHDLQLRSGGNATHAIVKANGNTWFGGLVGVGYQPEDLPSGLAGGVRCWDVVYSGGSYKASTIRSKENIRPLADVLERIECLNPVTFERSGDGAQPRPQLGFIAEEMREVFPECVVETDGDERDFFAWGLNQDALQGISIAGLQELLRRVKRLEAQLAKPPEDSRALPPAAPIEVLKEGSHVHGDGTRHAYVTVKFRATHPVFGSLATVRTLRLSAQPRAALLQREYERWVNSFDAVGHA